MSMPTMSFDRMLAIAMDPLFNSNTTSKPKMKTLTQVKLETLKALEVGDRKVPARNDYGFKK